MLEVKLNVGGQIRQADGEQIPQASKHYSGVSTSTHLGSRFPQKRWGAAAVFFILTIFFLTCPQRDFTVPFICGCFKDIRLGLHPTIPLSDLKLTVSRKRGFPVWNIPDLISEQRCCPEVSPPVWTCLREMKGWASPTCPALAQPVPLLLQQL